MKSTGTTLIRNSTAEFLIFSGQAGEQSIEARYEQETVRLTQKLMASCLPWMCARSAST